MYPKMDYPAALEEKEFLSHDTTWMNLKDTILSKIVTKEQMLYDFYSDEVVKIIKAENRMLVFQWWREQGLLNSGYRVSVLQDE